MSALAIPAVWLAAECAKLATAAGREGSTIFANSTGDPVIGCTTQVWRRIDCLRNSNLSSSQRLSWGESCLTTIAEPAPVALKQRLEPRERLLWWGQPKPGIRFRSVDWALVPFSLFWGGFAVVWEAIALNNGAPFFFVLFGIPFVVIGIYLIIGRFFHDAWRRAGTVYGVTTDRILIISRSTVKSVELRQLSELGLSESSDGSGSITFGPMEQGRGDNAWAGAPAVPTFEAIAKASQVHALVRRAQADLQPV